MTFALAALAVPEPLLLELELVTATPPSASAMTAAPAATRLVGLRENMESMEIARFRSGGYTEPCDSRWGAVRKRLGDS
jgi:hypothetical protein